MKIVALVSFSLFSIGITLAAHFRGGMITWEPDSSATSNSSMIKVIINQRYAWSRSLVPCNQANVLSRSLIGHFTITPLVCLSSASQCNAANYSSQQIASEVYCTDFSMSLGISFGRRSQSLFLPNRTKLVLAFESADYWLGLTYGSPAGVGWSLPVFIDLTPRIGIGINHSPTSTMPLMVNVPIRYATVIDIPMSDADSNDVIKCRWASSVGTLNGISVDECSGGCESWTLPSTVSLRTFTPNRCQVNVTLPYVGYYTVAIQIEDFNLSSSTIALSLVPLQFVLYGFDSYNTATNCMTPPIVTNMLPFATANGGNISVTVGVQFSCVVLARTGCTNDNDTYIATFTTESPSGMQKASFPYTWTTVPYYAMNLTWTPTIDQAGSTFTFCTTAIDVNGYSSQPYCINFLVSSLVTVTTSTATTMTTASTSTATVSTITISMTTTTTSVTTTTTTTTATTSLTTTTTSVTTATTSVTATTTTTTTATTSVTATTTTTTAATSVTTPTATTSLTTTTTSVTTKTVTTSTSSVITTTTITSSTSDISTVLAASASSSDDNRMWVLGLGLGLPLILLLASFIIYACCCSRFYFLRCKRRITISKITKCAFSQTTESNNQTDVAFDRHVPDYRIQYIRKDARFQNDLSFNIQHQSSPTDLFACESMSTIELNNFNATETTLFSNSTRSLFNDNVERRQQTEPHAKPLNSGSLLFEAFAKQQKRKPTS